MGVVRHQGLKKPPPRPLIVSKENSEITFETYMKGSLTCQLGDIIIQEVGVKLVDP